MAWIPLPARADLFAWPAPPVPPNMQTQSVAQRIIFNGLDMRAQVFESVQSPEDILAFYRKAWAGSVVVNRMGDEQVIGHSEGDYFMTVQVSVAGAGSKGSIGVVNTATAPKHFEPGKGLPKPMDSKVFNDIRYPDDPVPTRVVALRNALSPKQNASFYRERLEGEGWKPLNDHCGIAGCVIDYQRGDQKMNLAIESTQGNQSSLIVTIQNP
ncbi:MAG: hypothetical protein ACYC3A_11375 [Halothiobacillus sp.]